MSEPSNDVSSNPESFHRLKGFSLTNDDIGVEKNYLEINYSFTNTKRQELFSKVTKEMNPNNSNTNSFGRDDSSKTKDNHEIPVEENKEEKIEKNKIFENQVISSFEIKAPQEKKRQASFIKEKISRCFKNLIKKIDIRKNKFWDFFKPILLCYILALNCSIYTEIYVGLYNSIILSYLISKIVHKIYEQVLKEIQFNELLKELQVFSLDKDRKKYINENMSLEDIEGLNFLKNMSLYGSPFIGLATFPLLMTSLGSFAVILQCILIIFYYFLMCLIFRFQNNRKAKNNVKAADNEFQLNYQSKLALKDLSSAYIKFLQDFEKTKTKILEKSNFQNENALVGVNSNYLTKKTMKAGIARNKWFLITFRSIFEHAFMLIFVLLLIYFNYLLIYFFFGTNLKYLLCSIFCIIFALHREAVKYFFSKFFLYRQLYKGFRALYSFIYLFPLKLMYFIMISSESPKNVEEIFKDFVLLLILKTSFKIVIFVILGIIWFKIKSLLDTNEQQKMNSHRKNKKKKDNIPESMVSTTFFKGNKENLKEYLDKKGKEFIVSFFIFNFSDLISTLVIFISSITLSNIPKTRWYLLNVIIYEGYLRYFGIELSIEIVVIAILYFTFRKFVPLLKERAWLEESLKFLRKRGQLFLFGLYFMFYINFYCFDLYYLFPFISS